jgi:hypothetical protein
MPISNNIKHAGFFHHRWICETVSRKERNRRFGRPKRHGGRRPGGHLARIVSLGRYVVRSVAAHSGMLQDSDRGNFSFHSWSKKGNTKAEKQGLFEREMRAMQMSTCVLLAMVPMFDCIPAWVNTQYHLGDICRSRGHAPPMCRAPRLASLQMSGSDEIKRLAFEASHQRSLASQKGVEVSVSSHFSNPWNLLERDSAIAYSYMSCFSLGSFLERWNFYLVRNVPIMRRLPDYYAL